jgi:hypothetical protein
MASFASHVVLSKPPALNLLRQFEGTRDVAILVSFITAAEQDDNRVAAPDEIHPVTKTVIDPQDMTKTLACEVIVSEEVRITADVAADPRQEVAIRGRAEPMVVRVVANARALSAKVDVPAVVAAA